MYRNTRFGQLMEGLERDRFEALVKRQQSDKHSKGFRSWDQLVAMVYAQISGCRSLRELETGFNSQRAHHYHLGSRAIKRSTLADANAKRSSEVFAMVCRGLLKQAHRKMRGEIKELLYLIDSTPIPLKGLGYDEWAVAQCGNRTQGLKVHLMLAPEAELPVSAQISPANVNDVNIGRELSAQAGAMYVFDKGYCDYNWWYRLDQAGAKFVTRLKKNAGVAVQKRRAVEGDILEDATVQFKYQHPGGKRINHYYGTSLRRVVVSRADKPTPLSLVTNDFDRTAEEIGELYKRRWGIELFFKWLKQNLKIKRFLGRSENAVKIQIYTALITYLLMLLYRTRQRLGYSMKMCLVALRSGLFQRPEIELETDRKRRRRRLNYNKLQAVLPL